VRILTWGYQTVTWLLDGELVHYDSLGFKWARNDSERSRGVHMKVADAAELHTTWAARFKAKDLDGMVALAETDSVFVPQPGVVVAGEAAVRSAEQQFLNVAYRSR
jgi:hypothetical protein